MTSPLRVQAPEAPVDPSADCGAEAEYPPVTAVALNWCREDVTRECLQSLKRSDYQPLTILLVDNGSEDGSGERLRDAFPEVAYLQTGANLGYTGGNNRGIEWALERGAEWILILNNDTVLEPGAISHLLAAAQSEEGQVGGVVPKILDYDDPHRIWYGGGEFSPLRGLGLHWREGEADEVAETGVRDVTFMTGCCVLLRADALRKVDTFDEEFFAYIEDADLSLRLSRAGYRLLYQPSAKVRHHVPAPGTLPTPFQIRQRDRNRRRVMAAHFGLARRTAFLTRFYLTRVLRLAQYVVRRDWERAKAILDGMGPL